MSTKIIDAAWITMVCKEQITEVGSGLLVRAPAKINLSLLIAGKRPDGFHEIETIMAKVDFFDEILIRQGAQSGIELICTGPQWAPQGKDNLIYQACETLLAYRHSSVPLRITLTKNVPAAAGLGSASSDAAATLIAVNSFLSLGVEPKKLSEMAAGLGSDVPFFLNGPLAFCTGRGEKIKRFNKNFDFLALLALPDVSVSTKRVYENYRHHPDIYEKLKVQINSNIMKSRIDLIPKLCANMLEGSCVSLYRELGELKGQIEGLGIGPMCLSGSGSAMFCIIGDRDEEKARQYQNSIEKHTGCKSIIVSKNRW